MANEVAFRYGTRQSRSEPSYHGDSSTPIAAGAVDVVVPCYNYGRFLKGCVRSVLSQENVAVRVLIIDDASTDDSYAVAQAIAAHDNRVRVVRHRQNIGHIATYNEGLLDWARGEYTVLLSADDMLVPGSLLRAVRILNADPKIGFVYGRPFYFSGELELTRIPSRERAPRYWSGSSWIEGRCRSGHNVISSPEVVVRTAVQHRVGGYDPTLPHVADFDMWLRIAAVSDVAYVRGVPQAFYRKHASSMTTERLWMVDITERRTVFDKFFTAHRALIPNAAELHDAARRAIAREALWRACRSFERDGAELADLLQFARDTYTAVEGLPEYRGLRRRQRLGARVCRRTQIFAISGARRRLKNWLWWRHWEREGT